MAGAVSPARRSRDEIEWWLARLGTAATEVPVSAETLAWYEQLSADDRRTVDRWIRREFLERGWLHPPTLVAA